MKLNEITKAWAAVGSVVQSKWEKHEPDILFGSGIVAVTAGVVVSIVATVHETKLLKKADDTVIEVNEAVENNEITAEDANVVLAEVRKDTLVKTAVYYAPVLVLSSLGIGCLIGSHVELKRRNATLLLAYATLAKSFDIYRENVRKNEGVAADQAYLHGNGKQEIVVNEDGSTEVKVTNDMESASLFEVTIDKDSPLCQRSTLYTKCAVLGQLNAINQVAKDDGFISWNQIRKLFYCKSYDRKDPRWALGQKVGIIWDQSNTNRYQIDGGIYDVYADGTRVHGDFLDGKQAHNYIKLQFNCVYLGADGPDHNPASAIIVH